MTGCRFPASIAWVMKTWWLGQAIDTLKHLPSGVHIRAKRLAGFRYFVRNGMLKGCTRIHHHSRAKGLPEKTVVFGHALRNALLPLITIFGLSIPGLIGGSVIIESIFAIPGMGKRL